MLNPRILWSSCRCIGFPSACIVELCFSDSHLQATIGMPEPVDYKPYRLDHAEDILKTRGLKLEVSMAIGSWIDFIV